MKKNRGLPLNPLARLGTPFFYLLVFLIISFATIFIFVLRFLHHLRGVSSKVIILLTSGTIIVFFIYQQIFANLPSPYSLTTRRQKFTTQILDRNGRLLFKIYQDENRTPIKLSTLPPYVKQAFLAIEDSGFYKHTGFSVPSLVRATLHNLSPQNLKCFISNIRCPIEGGSTITQQLVKNALLSSERTWQRKVRELLLAIAVESVFDKDTILEMYLNEVGFGGPAYGIQEAASQYFGKNAIDLTLEQAAFLAGLPKAPSKYSPYIHPELAQNRQNLVLNAMLKAGYLSQDQFSVALATHLEFVPPQIDIAAPHFVMFIRDLLVDQYGEELVSHGGLRVTTSLDLDLQEKTEVLVQDELKRLTHLNVRNGAALITRPGSGEILAMVGSKNYFDIKNDGQVNLTTALRPPGSTIKVVNYALAFEKGATPNTPVKDEPLTFRTGTTTWTPKNYDNRFHGTQTIRSALANSYNLPAVFLLAQNGIANMISLGQKLGITTWTEPSRYGLALTLGGAAVKMTDLAVVYGTLANQGSTTPLNPIIRIEDSQGQPLGFDICLTIASPCTIQQVLKKETAFYLSDILSDNSARAAAFGSRSVLNLTPFKVAVKTGTSNDLRDNWTIGYTPDYLVTTWVGNNDNSPMNQVVSGITGASPIWAKIMRNLLVTNPNNTPFTTPETIHKVAICTLTNTLTCAGCPTRYEYFIRGNEPKTHCQTEDVQRLQQERARRNTEATPTGQIL